MTKWLLAGFFGDRDIFRRYALDDTFWCVLISGQHSERAGGMGVDRQ